MPYYWNIAPNVDFTFEPTEYTRRGIDLGGDLRFLTATQHGELDWDFLPHDSNFCSPMPRGARTAAPVAAACASTMSPSCRATSASP